LVFLALNSILLIAASIFLAVMTVRAGGVRERVNALLERLDDKYSSRRLSREVKKYTRPVTFRMTLPERMEFFFIDKSNIRHYLPFMNIHLLLLLMLLIFSVLMKPVLEALGFLPSAIVICLLFSMVPLFLLDLLARFNSESVRRKLAEFISVLNRWCSVREDIFYAFEKSVDSGIGEPLKTFIRDMVIQVSRGIEPSEALEMLQMKVDNIQFRDFIINVKQNIKHRGDIVKLLTNLEAQFYKIEEEYNRRRISTYKDRILIFCVMFAVLFLAYFFIRSNPDIERFYLLTIKGKLLLTLFSILFAGGSYLSFGITRFKY
jgi:Flp pilus assembly protein TadB